MPSPAISGPRIYLAVPARICQSEVMTAIREITKVKPDGVVEVRNQSLTPGAEVEVIVLVPSPSKSAEGDPYAFLKVLEEANLDGPRDWSAHLDDYLYHGKVFDAKPSVP